MKITKKQLLKIIKEEYAAINEENPRELVKQWVIEIEDFIASQFQGGKGMPISKLPQEEFPSIIEALESVRRNLKDTSARPQLEEGAHGSNITFNWSPDGLAMIMYVDEKEVMSFMTQKEVRSLVAQLEQLLAGPMRTSP